MLLHTMSPVNVFVEAFNSGMLLDKQLSEIDALGRLTLPSTIKFPMWILLDELILSCFVSSPFVTNNLFVRSSSDVGI